MITSFENVVDLGGLLYYFSFTWLAIVPISLLVVT